MYFNLCPLPLAVSLGTTEKGLAPFYLHPRVRHLYALIRSRWVFSELNGPSCLNLSLYVRCSNLLMIFTALCWTHSNKSISLPLSLCLATLPCNWNFGSETESNAAVISPGVIPFKYHPTLPRMLEPHSRPISWCYDKKYSSGRATHLLSPTWRMAFLSFLRHCRYCFTQ